MMEGRYTHWCAIETGEATTGSKSAYGQYSTVVTTQSSRCTFKSGGVASDLDSGPFAERLPSVDLPAATVLVEGQTLVGVSAGFVGNYRVKGTPRTVYNRIGVDHIEADLEAIP